MKLIYILVCILIITGCCNQEKADKAAAKLYSSEARERNKAAMELSGCGSKAAKAVPRLIELLYDDNIGVQSSSAFALRKIDTPEAQKALERATKKK